MHLEEDLEALIGIHLDLHVELSDSEEYKNRVAHRALHKTPLGF